MLYTVWSQSKDAWLLQHVLSLPVQQFQNAHGFSARPLIAADFFLLQYFFSKILLRGFPTSLKPKLFNKI